MLVCRPFTPLRSAKRAGRFSALVSYYYLCVPSLRSGQSTYRLRVLPFYTCSLCENTSILALLSYNLRATSHRLRVFAMSGVGEKRGRDEEEENICDAKRFHGLMTAPGEELLHLLDDIDSIERNLELEEEDQDCEPAEDLVNGVMRSLEEEIGVAASCSSDSPAPCLAEAEEEPKCVESKVDLGYLLEASDDELGIPPSRAEDPAAVALVDEQCSSDESCSDLLENPAVGNGILDSLWHLEDDVTAGYNLLEFGYSCDAAVNRPQELEGREFVNPCVLFEQPDAEHLLAWRHEAACGI